MTGKPVLTNFRISRMQGLIRWKDPLLQKLITRNKELVSLSYIWSGGM